MTRNATATTGNSGLDALADAIAERVLARLQQAEKPRLLTMKEGATYIGRTPVALRRLIALGAPFPDPRFGPTCAGLVEGRAVPASYWQKLLL